MFAQRPLVRVVHLAEFSQDTVDLVVEAVEPPKDLGELNSRFLFCRVPFELAFEVVLGRVPFEVFFRREAIEVLS